MTHRPARAPLLAAAVALAWGPPVSAQELALPSGLAARLFDVVLETDGGVAAPDAFTDPEGEEGEAVLAELGDDDPATPSPAISAPADDEGADQGADQGADPEADPLGEALRPPSGGLARFRLVVDGLGGEGADYDRVAGDFAWICRELALPALAANGWSPTEVVVALSDRETAFGVLDPDATQFFEGFRVEDGACVPQAF